MLGLLGSASLLPASDWLLSTEADAADLTLSLHMVSGQPPLAVVPRDFSGLGYEESSVARTGLLDAGDTPYVQLVRGLGKGVLRAGGIVADFTSYQADGKPSFDPKSTVITRANLQQLRSFLDAVDWRAIWSVNFGRGTVEEAIAETRDVAHILGPRLFALELGNEVENYAHGKSPLRSTTYSYEKYRAEFGKWRKAILAAVPGVSFAAPDTAASVEWVERMAEDAHGDVQLLTTHYYRGDQHKGTQDQLLQGDPNLIPELQRLHRASVASGVPWRMCEMNSFFGGGRPGVSDTLAGALWTLDTMLLLASNGCAGVNLETGVNQLGFLSSYSPIRNEENGRIRVGAPYYGMLAFALATTHAPEMLPIVFDAMGTNMTAYVLGQARSPRSVVLINKSVDRSVRVRLHALKMASAVTVSLIGNSTVSGTAITLGGAEVDADGQWHARWTVSNAHDIVVGPGSATILRTAQPDSHASSLSGSC